MKFAKLFLVYAILPAAVFGSVFAAWWFFGHKPREWFPSESGAEAGAFGDSFGFVSSLFSGLAFAGVILALVMQSRELSLQRQELKETREELRKTADAQEATMRTLALTGYINALAAGRETHAQILAANIGGLSRVISRRKHFEIVTQLNEVLRTQRTILGELVELRSIEHCLIDDFLNMLDSTIRDVDSIRKQEPIGAITLVSCCARLFDAAVESIQILDADEQMDEVHLFQGIVETLRDVRLRSEKAEIQMPDEDNSPGYIDTATAVFNELTAMRRTIEVSELMRD